MYTEATVALIDFIEQLSPIIYYPNGLDIESVKDLISNKHEKLDLLNKRYHFSNIFISELGLTNNSILIQYLEDLNKRVALEVELCKNNNIKFSDTVIFLYESEKDYSECVFTDLKYETEIHTFKESFKYYGNTLTINNFINICNKLNIQYDFNSLLSLKLNNYHTIPLIGKNLNINNIVSNYYLNGILNELSPNIKFEKVIVYLQQYDFLNKNSNNSLLNVCEKIIDLKFSYDKILNYIINNPKLIKSL
jgi:hypothetical protein